MWSRLCGGYAMAGCDYAPDESLQVARKVLPWKSLGESLHDFRRTLVDV